MKIVWIVGINTLNWFDSNEGFLTGLCSITAVVSYGGALLA